MRIVVIPGTNRRGALSAHLAKIAAADYVALGCEVDVLTPALGPEFLDPDVYKAPAPAVTALVARFLAADGVLFIVPEYNGSYPGILKLFIDQLPYPAGFDRRPCAFVGLSAGQFQGLRAVEHLQQVAGYRNAYVYPQRLFVGESKRQFDDKGQLTDPKFPERLKQQAAGFVEFIKAVKAKPAG